MGYIGQFCYRFKVNVRLADIRAISDFVPGTTKTFAVIVTAAL
jgi:hypothetical protein